MRRVGSGLCGGISFGSAMKQGWGRNPIFTKSGRREKRGRHKSRKLFWDCEEFGYNEVLVVGRCAERTDVPRVGRCVEDEGHRG